MDTPQNHLTCHETMDPATSPPSVWVRDQFREEEVPVHGAYVLCVPSTKVAVRLP